MGIELSDDLFALGQGDEVAAEDFAVFAGADALTASRVASHYEGATCGSVRVLHAAGHPFQGIFVKFFVSLADVSADVGEVEAAIAFGWLDCKARPHVGFVDSPARDFRVF